MLTKVLCLAAFLLTFPSTLPAWDLTPVQEATCREIGKVALTLGEARDLPMPRQIALTMIDTTQDVAPESTTFFTALAYWVYAHPELRGTALYVPAVMDCRQEYQRRYEAETKAQMRTDMAIICAKEADIGAAIAVKSRTMTQAQTFRALQDVDPHYADKTEMYGKLVPFVYARQKMAPAALRVAVTQHCRAGHEAVLKQQYGVELEQQQGWRR